MRRWISSFVLISAVLTTLVAALLVWLFVAFDAPGPLAEGRTMVISRGLSVEEIGGLLTQRGIVSHQLVFSVGVRLSGKASALRSGEFAFPAGITARAAMDILLSGKTVVRHLTIPEGLTTAQVLALVQNAEGLEGPLTLTPDEGALLPETYNYSWGDTRDGMVRRMTKAMSDTLADLWAKREPGSLLSSPEQALILASIVERETGIAAERPLVASVMTNRLKRGMRLQSDPTVAYGIAHEDHLVGDQLSHPLTRDDLIRPTPYNTYVIDGLPPAPIANPGRAAIKAALNPAQSDFLYFVANGTGGHAFAKTLDDHARNVAHWRALEKAGEKPLEKAGSNADQ
jgi:UPF0755 protein